MKKTAVNLCGRRAILAATLLFGLATPLSSHAQEQLPDPDLAIDPVAVGSVAAASTPVVSGRPLTATDVDPGLCAGGQLILDFVTGDLSCEWVLAE